MFGGILVLKKEWTRTYATLGFLLAGLSALRCFTLPGNTPLGRVVLPAAMLAVGILAVVLLKKSGADRDTLAFLLLPIGLALFLRAFLLPHATLDYQDFLSQWVEHFRQNGGFAALKDPVGNYNVPYLYLLAFFSYLPIPDLILIKLFSILFDVLLAWGGLRLTRRLAGPDQKAPFVCFSALLLLPTVVLNGAYWGQCDTVYAALCLHALACALEDRSKTSLALLALSLAFKLQAIFIIPLWCALWFSRRIKFRHLFVFPGVFFLSMAPALLLGKPAGDILSIYLTQAGDPGQHRYLNFNSPSVFSLLPYGMEVDVEAASRAGIAAAFVFTLVLLGLLFWRRKSLTNLHFFWSAAALCLGIPFFLPYMHERYFFLGGVLLVVGACVSPRTTPAAAAAELASLGGYHAYLMTRYAMTVTLFGITWAQLGEGLLMLGALAATVIPLAAGLLRPSTGNRFPLF